MTVVSPADTEPVVSARTSDLTLGGLMLALAGVIVAGMAAWPTARLGRVNEWFFPACLAVGIALVGASLVARGWWCPHRRDTRLGQLTILLATLAGLGWFASGWIAGSSAPALVVQLSVHMGPADYFALIVMGLVAVLALTRRSRLRAFGMLLVGLWLSMVGTDINTGSLRYTLGIADLSDGLTPAMVLLGFIVAADGLFCAISPSDHLGTYAERISGWSRPSLSWASSVALRLAGIAACGAAGLLVYLQNNSAVDVGLMIVLGLFGIASLRLHANRIVVWLGVIFGPFIETNLQRSLLIAKGDLAVVVGGPIGAALLFVAAVVLAGIVIQTMRRHRTA